MQADKPKLTDRDIREKLMERDLDYANRMVERDPKIPQKPILRRPIHLTR